MLVWLAALGCKGAFQAEERRETKQMNKNIWQAIEALVQQIPFSKQKVEAALSTVLTEKEDDFNKLFLFYKSAPIQLTEGLVISGVDLRIKREGGHPGFLVLAVEGACITPAQLREHYKELQITQVPRGRSLEEETTFTQTLPWGKLSFGFKERNRDCLASIVFEPQ